MSLASKAEIITTESTKKLICTQLLEFGRISRHAESEKIRNERYRNAQLLMERIHTRPVMKSFFIRGCKFTLFPAGHMSGAVMINIEMANQNILYTGDFSVTSMFGINGMNLPEEIHPEILLMNMPNAYQKKKVWDSLTDKKDSSESVNSYSDLKNRIKKNLQMNRNVYLISRSIPKHLDLFYFLNTFFPEIPVYLEPQSRKIADTLSNMGYQIYTPNIHISEKFFEKVGIIIGQKQKKPGCISVLFDRYSLHASVAETLSFIRKIHPNYLYMLHVYPTDGKVSLKYALENTESDMHVIQTENREKYYLKRTGKMKYGRIYQTVMEEELKIAEEQLKEYKKGRNKSTYEWITVYGSLVYPGLHPHEVYDKLQDIFIKDSGISYDDYCNLLHSSNLNNEEKRRYVLSVVESGITLLKKALDGDKESILKFSEFTETLERRDRKNGRYYFIGKYMIVFMLFIDPEFKSNRYQLVACTFGARYCNKLLRNIRNRLIKENGLTRKKKSARDVLIETENVLSESAKAEGMAVGDEYEQLQFKYINCKNSLELVQAMLDELNETVDETAAEAKKAAIVSFYTSMNSDIYGHLLDSIELVDRRLVLLKENKVKVVPQLLPLTIVFKQLSNFIKDSGIVPIDTTGREFFAEVEELAEYTYIGTPFSADDQKKKVIVEKPGWKYGNVVISLPTVREKEE